MITAPKVGSLRAPRISSYPNAVTIGCTVTPRTRSPAALAPTSRAMRACERLTSAALERSVATPPTSDLCTRPGESTFSTTG